MKTKKILSLLVCMIMLLSSLGVFTASAEPTVTELNVGKGVTYALPTTLDDATVTWTNNAGNTVTHADTSLVGVRYYTGTLAGATEPAYKYQINVGDYKVIMKDDFEKYPGSVYETEIASDDEAATLVGGAKFTKKAYTGLDDTKETTSGPKLVQVTEKDGTKNTVLELGPQSNGWGDVDWTPTHETSDMTKNAYRVTADFRTVDVDVSSKLYRAYFLELRRKNLQCVQLRLHSDDGVNEVTKVELRFGLSGTVKEVTDEFSWESTGTNLYSMTDYHTVGYAHNPVQWSTYLDGTEIENSVVKAVTTGNNSIRLAKTSASTELSAKTYIDNVTYEVAVYPTTALSEVPVTTSLAQGDSTNQTSTVALEMSDGTTKDFTVNWEADTSAAATGLTATGTIDGFDDTVAVTYNVVGVTTGGEINTFIGADAQLPNGTAVDTSKLGRKYYSVASTNEITTYPVNVGDWDVKRSDDMSLLTNTTHETYGLNVVADTNSDGFPMTAYLASNSTAGAVATTLDNNAVLKFTGKNPDSHIRWRLKDGFDGSFKYSMRMKIIADAATTEKRQEALRINIYNTTATYSYFYARVLTPATGESTIQIQPYRTNQQADTKATNVALTQNSDGKYETEWFDIVVIGKADTGTRDIYVNGVLTHRDYIKYDIVTTAPKDENKNPLPEIEGEALAATWIKDSTFESVAVGKAEDNTMTVYVDDVSVSSYYKFDGKLPTGTEVLVGKDKEAATVVPLTFSNNAVINIPATMPQLDTAKVGTYQTKAVLEGFDDTTTVKAKVCNYDISALAYKHGNEFTSAPLPGGTIYTAQVKNMSDDSQKATAVFAWYGTDDSLKTVQPVDISGIAEGETKTVEIGLSVPGTLEGSELTAADGYMKVFILDDFTTIRPLDLAETFNDFTYTAPRLFAAGDSTDQTYKAYRYPQAGIAQEYDHYFDVDVYNYSSSGKNTTTFRQELLWDKIISEAKTGDYVIIAFGHNDQSATTAADYEANIKQYVAEARAKGINPILRNPIARRKEGINGTAYAALNGDNAANQYNNPDLAGKMDALEKVATELNVPFIDMIDISSTYLQEINGDEGDVTYNGEKTDKATAKLYVCDFCFNWDSAYASLRDWTDTSETGGTAYTWAAADFRELHGIGSKQDNTHPTIYGANVWAQMIANEIADKDLILSKYAKNLDKTISYPSGEIAE